MNKVEEADEAAISVINQELSRKVNPEIIQTQMGYMKNKFMTQNICKQCPPIQEDLKTDMRDIRASQVNELLRNREIDALINSVQDIDYTTPSSFPMVLKMKMKDRKELIKFEQKYALKHKQHNKDPNVITVTEQIRKEMGRYRAKKEKEQLWKKN